MDKSTNRTSGLPRPSRLPVPRGGLRPSNSRETLQGSSLSVPEKPALRHSTSNSRLSAVVSPVPHVSATPSRANHRVSYAGPSASQQKAGRSLESSLGRRTSQLSLRAEGNGYNEEEHQSYDPLRVGSQDTSARNADSRKPRPSLSERTVETLQQIPSSPALHRRSSNFFNSESPMRPPSRTSGSSRPSSSDQFEIPSRPVSRSSFSRPDSSADVAKGPLSDIRASANSFYPSPSSLSTRTPVKRQSMVNLLKTPVRPTGSITTKPPALAKRQSLGSIGSIARAQSSTYTPVKANADLPTINSGSKTVGAKTLRPRPSVNSLFRKPSMPSLGGSTEIDRIGFTSIKKSPTFSNTSSEGTSVTSKASKVTTASSAPSDDQDANPRKASLALRDQIAKAKAAKRAAMRKASETPSEMGEQAATVPGDGSFDFGLSDDPFNQNMDPSGNKGLLRKRIDAGRTTGRLNIAAMGFKEIPEEVLNMYNLEAIGGDGSAWAESVDLTRFVAADNEIEFIGDNVFPDFDSREAMDDDDESKGNQFGGLETLDLHGNLLKSIPLGFRRLELLTTLNLSNNKLDNQCLEIISQVPSLRDLKLAGNALSGPLGNDLAKLENLEILEIQRNDLTSLPDDLVNLVHLRILNIGENRFASLPFEKLRYLPLVEIIAPKNNLSGVLITEEVEELSHLQVLDVTGNSLTEISMFPCIRFPALHQLSCSSNRLSGLPEMTTWTSLLTLTAEDNNISALPEGFTSLPKVKIVDFNGNNIKTLDPAIGAMENLDVFHVSANPLQEKKFSSMTTEELKRALKARLEPEDNEIIEETLDEKTTTSAPLSPNPLTLDWPVLPGGTLDRSNTGLHSLNPVAIANIASNNNVKEFLLQRNAFTEIPTSVAFFATTLTALNLAHNELSSDTYLKDDIELPMLKELNLSSNTFNSLQPLLKHFKAPNLEKLDISFNRLTSLPVLRTYFPNLTMLLASNNTIRELSPEAVKGLRVLDCSSNEINSLNARIGLLGGPGGLERLDVSGNRFRVPKYTILEKGTEATLSWLRDRIPVGEAGASEID
ncbi:hypothetical protein F5884DRAFT_732952 [Xylogone sp. PMI_703]|nr:hypothetical protein F5884DRAFT_732952 [Xylogone sp. PMI_703]